MDLSSDPIPIATPPAEVLEEMKVAAQAHDRLAAAGQRLRFELDPESGGVSIMLTDTEGTPLSAVSPSTVLHVASGDWPI